MATSTVYQRVHLWIWHSLTGGVEDSYLAKLYDAGARVLCVQLQDDGPLPKSLIDRWKGLVKDTPLYGKHFTVHGVVRPSGEPLFEPGDRWAPETVASWASAEKVRLGLHGMRFNFEDDVEGADLVDDGAWSRAFVKEWRRLRPTLPSVLDTYKGAAGMRLECYREAGFRLAVQTYDATGLWTDPPTSLVEWTKGRGWPKGYVRPVFQVAKFAGERLAISAAIADSKEAGMVGVSLYYVDGAFDVLDEYLVPFVKRAIGAGIARA